ncbi:zinc finger protein 90-like [Oppia nitens]|uniref:zinc finger protein 90-like n=1 Tax=Oppia nitens TaxID=1686743 RepID=UPI0023DCE4D4|nr:zinc finger protein 90-like [Oppia nitens]
MCEIVVNDLFDEIINENNRLCNQLVFAMKCLDVLQTFETFIRKVMTFKTIIINEQQLSSQDIQTLDQLDNQLTDVLTQLKKKSAQSIKPYEKQLITGNVDQLSGKELIKNSGVNINKRLTVNPIRVKTFKLTTIDNNCSQQSHENDRQTQQMTDNFCGKQFPCFEINCDYKSCYITELINHLKTCHSITRIQCTREGCTQLIADKHDLNRHLQTKHKTINEKVKKSNIIIINKSHTIRKYNIINKSVKKQMNVNNSDNQLQRLLNITEKRFKCFAENCDYNSLNVNELVDHLKTLHSITCLNQCTYDDCHQLFADERQLKSHVLVEHKSFDSSLIDLPNDCNETHTIDEHKTNDSTQVVYDCHRTGCNFWSFNSQSLETHLKKHTKKDKSISSDSKLSVQHKLNQHLRYEDNNTDYRCDYNGCDRVFKYNNSLIGHKIRQHDMKGSKLYRCLWPDCQYKSYFSCAYKRHQLIHSDVRNYRCDYPGCQYRAKEKRTIISHKRLKHFTTGKNYRCSWFRCAKQFKTADNLRKHMRLKHLIAEEDKQKFRCDYEGCDRVFNAKSSLQYHTISVHEKQAKIYQCSWPGCDYTTKHSNRLSQHEIIHKPIKDIRCDYDGCNFTTKHNTHLIRHKERHLTEPKYRCSWPECDKQFKTLSSFKSHEVIHSEPKYVCHWKDCQYRTHWSKNLKSHLNRKHLKKL